MDPSVNLKHPTKRTIVSIAIAATGLAILIAGVRWLTVWRLMEETNNAYVQGDITPVASRVGGYVVELRANDNDVVSKGDVLARIDRAPFEARLNAKDAELSTNMAETDILDQKVEMQALLIEQASAALSMTDAEYERSSAELRRSQGLLKSGNTARQQHDLVQATFSKAEAGRLSARASEGAAKAQRNILHSERKRLEGEHARLEAERKLLEIDLRDTLITAPISGVVGNRAIRAGQLAEPGRYLLAIVPLDSVWVVANFKETQLTRMRSGQPATIRVDSFPDQRILAVVDSLSPASGAEFSLIPPQNATGNFTKVVQRVPVKLRLTPGPLTQVLRPGMSTEVTVDTRKGSAKTGTASRKP